MRLRLITIAPLALAWACSSAQPEGHVLGGPPTLARFSSQLAEGSMWVKARFRPDHESLLGVDLIEEHGIVPVWIELRVLPNQVQDWFEINLEQVQPLLYLQDGTALSAVRSASVSSQVDDDSAKNRIQSQHFEGGIVTAEDRRSGFVFFTLRGRGDFQRLGKRRVGHTTDDRTKIIDVGRSLLAFNVIDSQRNKQRVYVGLSY